MTWNKKNPPFGGGRLFSPRDVLSFFFLGTKGEVEQERDIGEERRDGRGNRRVKENIGGDE